MKATSLPRLPLIGAAVAISIFAGCVTATPITKNESQAARSLRLARSTSTPVEARAGFYLQAAALSAPLLGTERQPSRARETYNTASAELTELLRSAEGGRWWNRPVNLAAGDQSYRLNFQAGQRNRVWAPDYFSAFKPASEVAAKIIKRRNLVDGVGGVLVGVRKQTPPEPFAPLVGVTAPVTATLDFQGRNATLTLRDPSEQTQVRVAGAMHPLAADFSAPLAYYPAHNETIAGLMGALRAGHYMDKTGLYMLQPYDPDRIPLIFVHGLISTAQMWRNVINEIESDPTLRGRFQCWVFNYPTGNPVAYSALRFREELAKAEQVHGFPKGFVLVSHSMGGIVSRMQATTVDRAAWDRVAPSAAEKFLIGLPKDGLIHRSLIFDANPNLRRVVFICTPHRGSDLAIGGIGELAMRLISLPSTLTSTLTGTVATSIATITGSAKRMPNSINSLSPKNPTLKVMGSVPMRAPQHTIYGDRGKGDSPHSSDGVVPYWSSHIDSAQSEQVVPGPHGACELPETIDELKRILHLHLSTAGR